MSDFDGDVADRQLSLRNARWRAWLRSRTPNFLYHRLKLVVPKARGCGEHEWHNQGDGVDACYHCVATRSTPSKAPWFGGRIEQVHEPGDIPER